MYQIKTKLVSNMYTYIYAHIEYALHAMANHYAEYGVLLLLSPSFLSLSLTLSLLSPPPSFPSSYPFPLSLALSSYMYGLIPQHIAVTNQSQDCG